MRVRSSRIVKDRETIGFEKPLDFTDILKTGVNIEPLYKKCLTPTKRVAVFIDKRVALVLKIYPIDSLTHEQGQLVEFCVEDMIFSGPKETEILRFEITER